MTEGRTNMSAPDDLDRLNALIDAAARVLYDCDMSAVVETHVDAALESAAIVDRLMWGRPGAPVPRGVLSGVSVADRKRDSIL